MDVNLNSVLAAFGIEDFNSKSLEGYDSHNFKIATATNNYVLKIYQFDETLLQELKAENDILIHLYEKLGDVVQKIFPTKKEQLILTFEENGKKYLARLLHYLEGTFLAEANQNETLIKNLGTFLAKMNLALKEKKSAIIKAKDNVWDLQQNHQSRKHLKFIDDPANRRVAHYFLMQYEEKVRPIENDLPKSIIQGDANDWNVLVNKNDICGLIDFGDMSYGPRINELAVCLMYVLMQKENLIETACQLVSAYHKILPLNSKEINALYYLIGTRLAVSIANSGYTKTLKPKSEYITISEKPAIHLMHQLIEINPIKFANEINSCLGFAIEENYNFKKDVERRHRHTSKALSITFEKPINMVGAAFQYMYDKEGNTYLDAYNNIPHVGHTHPAVVEVAQNQIAQLNTNSRYLSEVHLSYAEELLSHFPENLNKIFFVNSGSAANDLAIRMAWAYSQHKKILVMEHGYHGNTQIGIDISHYKFNRKGGEGKASYIEVAELPNTFTGKYTLNDGTAGKKYAEDLFSQLENNQSYIAAFIAEPIVGCGGQAPLAKGYLNEVYPFIRAQGGICISDEVQTGFGRLGDVFWGYELYDVVPDIVVLGKPIGNGHPLAAVVCTNEIAKAFETGMEFFSSFGANPVSCAIGHQVLKTIKEESLQTHAKQVGDYLLKQLKTLELKHDTIGEARGNGLFLGVELVLDKQSKNPNTQLAKTIKNKMKENGILIGTDGPYDNVLKIKPPLPFNKNNADQLVCTLDMLLSDKISSS